MMHRILWSSVIVLFASASFSFAGDSFPIANKSRRSPVVEVVEKSKSAVVNILSERNATANTDEPFGPPPASAQKVNGMGSGIIIDSRGYIITNHHVVEDVTTLRVRLHDGSSYSAKVIARDPETDLALMKIDAGKPLPTITFGTSHDLMVGEPVIAIGNAYGYEHTVTTGVVSYLKRDVTLNKDLSYKALIQTDASINPGNSGGPLLNIHGELIGVNVAIRAGAHGIAFAIPVDSMIRVASEMISARRRSGLWHGLIVKDVAEGSDGPVKRTLIVERCEATSPAVTAGFQAGDVVTKVGEFDVRCSLDLERALIERATGDKVPVVVRRDGADTKLELVIQGVERVALTGNDLIWRKLGVKLQPTQNDTITRINGQLHGGLVLVDVNPTSPAGKAGLQRGDILIGLHQWETISPDNVTFVLTHPDLATFTPLRFFIIRSGQIRRGWLSQVD